MPSEEAQARIRPYSCGAQDIALTDYFVVELHLVRDEKVFGIERERERSRRSLKQSVAHVP